MNILCPSCHSSIPVSETDPQVRCDACGLTTDLSSIGTYPGGSSLPAMRDLTGETVGRYNIASLIGIGGMGVVYRASRVDDGVEVAFKALHDSYEWRREEFVARFEREARALTRLEHPGIVRILDSGRQGDLYYIVTEYVDGADLAQRLRGERLELGEIVAIMGQICQALSFAHQSGIVHRDIKPANIIVAGGAVKVLDFGLAQITGGDSQFSTLTRTDLAMGTFNYLSPEQRTNAKQVDERSDIFSLGVVFFEMLTGSLPLGNFQPPSRARADADRRYDQVVARSLSTDPADRYQTVEELAADIEQLRTRRSRARTALVAGAAGLAGVAAAVALALFLGAADGATVEAETDFQKIEDQADRGQIPPFVDVGQIQQAAEQQLANDNAEANPPPPTDLNPLAAEPAPEQQPLAKKPVKKKTGKKKPSTSKGKGKKGFAKGAGDKIGGKGFDDPLSDALLGNNQPATGTKKPAPVPKQPAQSKNPPAQTEQQQAAPQGKTKGKTKGKGGDDSTPWK